jgi:hypothetical protein
MLKSKDKTNEYLITKTNFLAIFCGGEFSFLMLPCHPFDFEVKLSFPPTFCFVYVNGEAFMKVTSIIIEDQFSKRLNYSFFHYLREPFSKTGRSKSGFYVNCYYKRC